MFLICALTFEDIFMLLGLVREKRFYALCVQTKHIKLSNLMFYFRVPSF